jgi:hypothetical protein
MVIHSMLEIMNQAVFQPKIRIDYTLYLKAFLMEQFEDLQYHKVDMYSRMIVN